MNLNTTDILITRVYLSESSDILDEIIEYLRDDAKISGFSVFRAIRGFGDSGEHTTGLIDISLSLPIIVEFFDTAEIVTPIIKHLTQWVKPKHITFWPAKTNSDGTT